MDYEVLQLFLENVFIQIALALLVALLVQMIVRASISRVVQKVVKSHKYKSKLEEKKREDTLASIFHTTSGIVIWVITIIVVLSQLGVNLTALITGAGIFGVIIGFGAQNALKDYLAGVFIIAENQYRVGDIITLNVGGTEVSGVVEGLAIRITQLRDLDGNLHTIANGAASIITNRSFEFANVNIDIGVSYDTDLDKVRDVLNRVGTEQAEDEAWREKILEPIQFLRVDNFMDSSVILKSVGKVLPAMQWEAAGDFRLRVKKAFDKEGIVIPFPQVVMHQLVDKK